MQTDATTWLIAQTCINQPNGCPHFCQAEIRITAQESSRSRPKRLLPGICSFIGSCPRCVLTSFKFHDPLSHIGVRCKVDGHLSSLVSFVQTVARACCFHIYICTINILKLCLDGKEVINCAIMW
jgi:hypothetical protein